MNQDQMVASLNDLVGPLGLSIEYRGGYWVLIERGWMDRSPMVQGSYVRLDDLLPRVIEFVIAQRLKPLAVAVVGSHRPTEPCRGGAPGTLHDPEIGSCPACVALSKQMILFTDLVKTPMPEVPHRWMRDRGAELGGFP